MYIARHVIFDESQFPYLSQMVLTEDSQSRTSNSYTQAIATQSQSTNMDRESP